MSLNSIQTLIPVPGPKETPTTLRYRLKQVQDRIYEAKSRIGIINNKGERQTNKTMYRKKMNSLRESIRDFSQMRKTVKDESLNRRSLEVDRYFEANQQKRNKHKAKIEEIRQQIKNHNRVAYDSLKKEKAKFDSLIKKEKEQQIEAKRIKRQKLFEEQRKRSQFLKQYLQNRHNEAKIAKLKETETIELKIKQRYQQLQRLEKQSSQLSISLVNPQSINASRTSSKRVAAAQQRASSRQKANQN